MEDSFNGKKSGYRRIEKFDRVNTEKISEHYREIIDLLGEDVLRVGLEKTPVRVAKAMQILLQGYEQDPEAMLRSAMFKEDYRQMVIVKDIEI